TVVVVLAMLLEPRRRGSGAPPPAGERQQIADGAGVAPERTLVVLPTYNERATIREVVTRVLATVPEADVLVIDDGYPDGTRDLGAAIVDAYPRCRPLRPTPH